MMKSLKKLAYVLLIIGGLNWGLKGFFDFDLVVKLFGNASTLTKVVYDLVGLSAVYMMLMAHKKGGQM